MKIALQILGLGVLGFAVAQAAPVAPTLKGDLIALDGKKPKPFADTKLANAKYFAVYYSASWCGPCRAFTPKLVEWYKKTKPAHPEFELIFVSSDNSEKEMEEYMIADAMPWPALVLAKKKTNKSVTRYAGQGIPCLVFIDAEGGVLSNSYEGTTYVGPHKVLADIDKTLAAAPAGAAPVSGAVGTTPTQPRPQSVKGATFDEFFKKK